VYKQRNKKSLFNGFTFDYCNCLKKVKTLIVEHSQSVKSGHPWDSEKVAVVQRLVRIVGQGIQAGHIVKRWSLAQV